MHMLWHEATAHLLPWPAVIGLGTAVLAVNTDLLFGSLIGASQVIILGAFTLWGKRTESRQHERVERNDHLETTVNLLREENERLSKRLEANDNRHEEIIKENITLKLELVNREIELAKLKARAVGE